MKLSENFSLKEMTQSRQAVIHGIDNTPSLEEIVSLTSLCHRVLQPIRDAHGVVSVSSGFRSKSLAPLVGSTIRSPHCFGMAVDFECFSVPNDKMAIWMVKNLDDWDDLILEHFIEGEPNSGWIHVSFNRAGGNRKRVRKAYKKGKKTIYDPWEINQR